MIKRARPDKVTFVLPAGAPGVSVVGDFNGWDPAAHPLKRRSNGTRSATVRIDPGRSYRFRYFVAAEGRYFDDPEADRIEPNGLGETHSVVVL